MAVTKEYGMKSTLVGVCFLLGSVVAGSYGIRGYSDSTESVSHPETMEISSSTEVTPLDLAVTSMEVEKRQKEVGDATALLAQQAAELEAGRQALASLGSTFDQDEMIVQKLLNEIESEIDQDRERQVLFDAYVAETTEKILARFDNLKSRKEAGEDVKLEIEQLKADSAKLDEEIEEESKVLTKLRNRESQLKTSLAALRKTAEQKTKELNKLGGDITELRKEVAGLKRELGALDDEIRHLEDTKGDLERLVREAQERDAARKRNRRKRRARLEMW